MSQKSNSSLKAEDFVNLQDSQLIVISQNYKIPNTSNRNPWTLVRTEFSKLFRDFQKVGQKIPRIDQAYKQNIRKSRSKYNLTGIKTSISIPSPNSRIQIPAAIGDDHPSPPPQPLTHSHICVYTATKIALKLWNSRRVGAEVALRSVRLFVILFLETQFSWQRRLNSCCIHNAYI